MNISRCNRGEKFRGAFDTLVIFSTNSHPETSCLTKPPCAACSSRFKSNGPTKEEFLRVFALVAKRKGMPLDRLA